MALALRERRTSVDPIAGMKLNSDLRFHLSAGPEISWTILSVPRVIRWYPWVRAGIRWHSLLHNWPAELSHRGSTLVAMDPQDHTMLEALVRHGRRGQLNEFLAQGDGFAWCRPPIRLRGYVVSSDAVGCHITYTSASLPDGVFLKACGSRSEVRCPACAQVYRGDARHLVRTGLEGGKGVSEAVAGNPAVFLTLTAPSFGAVHTITTAGDCHSGQGRRRCVHDHPNVCTQRHRSSDEMVGTPPCPDCYDYAGAVLHNACTPELWRRTTIYLARQLASALGVEPSHGGQAPASLLLSGGGVPASGRRPPPRRRTGGRARGRIPIDRSRAAGRGVCSGCSPLGVGVPLTRAGLWGKEMDVQILGHGDERAAKVATYVAK